MTDEPRANAPVLAVRPPAEPLRTGAAVVDPTRAADRFDVLYRAEFEKLAGTLLLVGGQSDSTVAADVAQETFVRAWERWDRLEALDRPAGWLYVTAFRLMRKRLRRERRRPALEQRSVGLVASDRLLTSDRLVTSDRSGHGASGAEAGEGGVVGGGAVRAPEGAGSGPRAAVRRDPAAAMAPSGGAEADAVADRLALDRALASLSVRQRQAVVCRHVLGLDGPEAAAVLGMKPDAFRQLLRRSLAELRAHPDLQEVVP